MQKINTLLLSSALCAGLVYGDAAVLLPKEKRTFDQSRYIPDISAIVDFSYVDRNKDDDAIKHLEIPGVVHGLLGEHKDGDKTHSTYNAKQGFNLNYVELVMSSSVDPYFSMDATFHFDGEGVEIEEAYFTSTNLGNGLRFRGGKQLSNFGYLNKQHHHYWDFGDMPLVYEAFLGTHGINELGAQLQWTAPTSFYLMAGVEVLQGDNESMFGNKTIGDSESPIAKGVDAPSLTVGYVKTSFEISDTTIFAGISYAQGDSRLDHRADEAPSVFTGDAKLYGADLVVLHPIDSYSSLKWQSEFLSREMDGRELSLAADKTTISATANESKEQSGLYSQLIYTHDQNWKAGLRYDTIYQNDVVSNGVNANKPEDMKKYSAMIEYHTSEFARYRLQYNVNNALYNEDGQRQKIKTLMLQANIAIGAHAAHSF